MLLSIFSSNVYNTSIFGHSWGIVRILLWPVLLNLFMILPAMILYNSYAME